jgi:PmbA protein
MMGRGLLVEDLDWSSGPNPIRGTLHLRAPWSYLVESGRIAGRLEGIGLAGNLFDALGRILAVGGDASWIGAVCTPSLLFESMTVVTATR